VPPSADLRNTRARTEIPALRSPDVQRVLAASLAAAFGVAIPDHDLDRLTTVRDVLQCVRLHRWAARVEGPHDLAPAGAPADHAGAHLPLSALRAHRRAGPPPLPSNAAPPPAGRREARR